MIRLAPAPPPDQSIDWARRPRRYARMAAWVLLAASAGTVVGFAIRLIYHLL